MSCVDVFTISAIRDAKGAIPSGGKNVAGRKAFGVPGFVVAVLGQ